MAIKKRITLHPLLNDGTPDENVNLYPKTLIDGIVDREGEQVEVSTKEELNSGLETKQDKLNAGENIVIEDNTISASVDLSDYYTKATVDGLLARKQERINENNEISADFVDDTHSNNKFVTNSEKNVWNNKQDKLVSSVNIKTVNGNSLLGGGNILISAVASWGEIRGNMSAQQDLTTALNSKQGKLTAGTGIAITDNNVISVTIEGIRYDVVQELPATGESGIIYLISNSGTAPNVYDEYIWVNNNFEKIGSTEIDLSNYYTKTEADNKFQVKLVSGTNIKTINNQSVLGSGNLNLDPAGGANLTPLEVPDNYMVLMEFINDAQTPETYTISNDNEVTIEILKQDTTETISISKGSIISVYPGWSATILSADGQYTYFIDGDYLYGGVSINYEEVEAIVDEKLGTDVVMTNTEQSISGQKTFTSPNGTIFENAGGLKIKYLSSSPEFKLIPDNNGNFDFWYNTTKLAQLNSNYTFLYRTLLPSANTIDLGSSQYQWGTIYASTLRNGNIEKPVNRIVTDDNNILPQTGGILTLGNQSYRWNALYLGSTINFNPQQITKIENLKTLSVNTINLGNQVGSSTTWSDTKFLQYDTTSVKYVGKLYAGLDVNNQPIRNIPDTPDEGTSPINKNYADTNLQGKLTAGTGIAITNNVISSTLEGINYEVVQSLPSTGVKGTIYLVPNGSSEQQNIYDEYIWLPPQQEGESGSFEFIGTTQTDLSNYVDLDSPQTISGNKTIASGSNLSFAGTNIGVIENSGNYFRIKLGGNNKLNLNTNVLYSAVNICPNSPSGRDLGDNSYPWRNVKFTGYLGDGHNSNYGLVLPDTTGYTANKTIATTDQITKQWFGTQAEYDALGTYDNDTIYNILES